jgi:hypothetical protein
VFALYSTGLPRTCGIQTPATRLISMRRRSRVVAGVCGTARNAFLAIRVAPPSGFWRSANDFLKSLIFRDCSGGIGAGTGVALLVLTEAARGASWPGAHR